MPKRHKHIKHIETPYKGIGFDDYSVEKRRLQLELLKAQQRIVVEKKRLIITFDGRDAAGKGATIRRLTEKMMPKYYNVVELGIPTKSESKYWFKRYRAHFPAPGEITFFDRSWYNRALIEPTMGYCSESKYIYFMKKALKWEHGHIDKGLILIKFYLSVDSETQLLRFHERLSDPLKFWKFSENDFHARAEWERFTMYKEQMFARTSSPKSPWVVVNANNAYEARLTCMLHIIRTLGNSDFVALTGKDVPRTYTIEINGVPFQGLNAMQYATLHELSKNIDNNLLPPKSLEELSTEVLSAEKQALVRPLSRVNPSTTPREIQA
jgi:polyphosphate kinase 2